jgi:hypothetical protein
LTAPDDEIGDLVAERRALRQELEDLRRAGGNVVNIDDRRGR